LTKGLFKEGLQRRRGVTKVKKNQAQKRAASVWKDKRTKELERKKEQGRIARGPQKRSKNTRGTHSNLEYAHGPREGFSYLGGKAP